MKQQKLTNREIADLCLKLSLLLHAGVGIAGGLSLLAEDEADDSRRTLFTDLSRQMDEGRTLSDAFTDSSQFPDYVCDLIHVGEETGRTEEALRALAQYYEERSQLDRRLRSALLYPAVLLLIMLTVIVVLLTKVLPVFQEVYQSLGGQLTGIAGGLLSVGSALNAVMPLLCVLLTAAVLLLGAFAGLPQFREKVLAFWQKHRGDKGISRKLNTARFAQALAMGLGSGLAIEDALTLAESLLTNLPSVKERCTECRRLLDAGVPLAQAMGETELLPVSQSRLLSLGMHSGSQDTVMEEIARRLSEESDTALETRLSQIEPTLVVITSILVGLILLSVMLPLMHIMTAIG